MASWSESVCCSGQRSKDASPQDKEAADLQRRLSLSEEERRTSLRKVSQDLEELSSKLENAEGSFMPWMQVNGAKRQVADLQTEVDEQIDDAKQKQEEMQSEQGLFGVFTTPGDVRAKQNGVVQNQQERRTSLSEVKESLSAVASKLENAQAGWAPWDETNWTDVNDAKQVAADIQGVVGQRVNDQEEADKVQGS